MTFTLHSAYAYKQYLKQIRPLTTTHNLAIKNDKKRSPVPSWNTGVVLAIWGFIYILFFDNFLFYLKGISATNHYQVDPKLAWLQLM